jgi:putative hydrolase of the HAD superfamily
VNGAVREIRRCLRGARHAAHGGGTLRPLPAQRLPRVPRAVLFDVYGTLLLPAGRPDRGPFSQESRASSLLRRHAVALSAADVAARIGQVVNRERESLRARGIPHPEVRIERIWAGMLPGRTEAEIGALAAGWEAAVRPVAPAPGCRALLGRLRSAGLSLGILSNAQFYTPLFFEVLLGGQPKQLGFSPPLCVWSYELSVAKPMPELFALAADRLAGLGIEPREAVVVGNDPRNDAAPAAACGFMTVLVGRALPAEGADVAIKRLADLAALVIPRG